MILRKYLLLIGFLASFSANSQFFEQADSLRKDRLYPVIATEALGYGSSIYLLDRLWYQYYDRTSFHSFNDNPEWLQMDKAGHVMTSYYMGFFGYEMLKWSGVPHKQALWYGGTLGSLYLLSMETLDGFSEDWGFSWGDVGANAFGTAAFMLQQHYWQEQRITVKFSAHLTEFHTYRPELLGRDKMERIMKDYNGQTYWLSANVSSFLPVESKFPQWLNVAGGYSGERMISGRPEDNVLYPGDFERYRQYYLSLDIDFGRIPVNRAWQRTCLKALNVVKLPFPALEFSKHGLKGYFLYF